MSTDIFQTSWQSTPKPDACSAAKTAISSADLVERERARAREVAKNDPWATVTVIGLPQNGEVVERNEAGLAWKGAPLVAPTAAPQKALPARQYVDAGSGHAPLSQADSARAGADVERARALAASRANSPAQRLLRAVGLGNAVPSYNGK